MKLSVLAVFAPQALLSYAAPTESNATATDSQSPYYGICGADEDWYPPNVRDPSVVAADCEAALFQMTDLMDYFGEEPGMFMFHRGRTYAHFPSTRRWLTLPQRYTSGTCTITLMMMKMWEAKARKYVYEWRPDSERNEPWPNQEKVSWVDLTSIIGVVRSTCRAGLGYRTIGDNLGVGIATWGTGSGWDIDARNMFPGPKNNDTEMPEGILALDAARISAGAANIDVL